MKLQDKLNEDLKIAMKARNENELLVLRMLIAAIKNKKITLGNINTELSEEQVIEVVSSEIKKRKDSITSYRDGEREDLAKIEEAEKLILQKYMPEQMSLKEIEEIVKEIVNGMGEVTMQDFGKVMGQAMGRLKGKADGNDVGTAVKKILK